MRALVRSMVRAFDNLLMYFCAIAIGALCALLLYMILTAGPAGALINTPGQDDGGYIHMTPQEVAVRVKDLFADPNRRGSETPTFSDDGTIVLSGTPYWLLIEAGFSEYFVSRFDTVLRYDDPFWAVKVAEHPTFSEWQYSYSLTR